MLRCWTLWGLDGNCNGCFYYMKGNVGKNCSMLTFVCGKHCLFGTVLNCEFTMKQDTFIWFECVFLCYSSIILFQDYKWKTHPFFFSSFLLLYCLVILKLISVYACLHAHWPKQQGLFLQMTLALNPRLRRFIQCA